MGIGFWISIFVVTGSNPFYLFSVAGFSRQSEGLGFRRVVMAEDDYNAEREINGDVGEKMEIDGVVPHQLINEFNPDYLKIYYKRIFPFVDMYKWLAYGNDGKHPACDSSYFGRREFSFTLEHDIYLRYMSFRDATEFEAAVCDKCPYKIDIGAVYNVDPAKRLAYANVSGDRVFAPVERELVFDVDMTDYDDIRNCCTGADICLQCWPLMTIAIKVLDTSLREDFGFEHLLWVYSGRRGVHCWVCDPRARRLTNDQRMSIADYFRVYKGNENNNRKVTLTGAALHPLLGRAYSEVLCTYFEEQILPTQSLLHPESHFENVLKLIPEESVAAQLRDRWNDSKRLSLSKDDINGQRWRQLKEAHKKSRRCIEEIVFTHTYPRLDLEVSKHMNHLLKAPFCVHPKTGRVCVPIDPEDSDNFDPTMVPTMAQLLDELNKESHTGSASPDWERTSLAKSVHFFRSSFLEPLLKDCKSELEANHHQKLQELSSRPNLSW